MIDGRWVLRDGEFTQVDLEMSFASVEDILEVLEYNLAREGFQVLASRDGEEGLRLVRRTPSRMRTTVCDRSLDPTVSFPIPS